MTVSDSALLSSLSTLSSFLTAPSVVAFLGSISISLVFFSSEAAFSTTIAEGSTDSLVLSDLGFSKLG